MSVYFFQLGSTPELSFQELQALVTKVELVLPQVAKAELTDDSVAIDLMNRLGGTIKIIKQISTGPHQVDINSQLITILADLQPKVFALAEWGRDHLPKIDAAEIKQSLKNQGVISSYKDQTRQGLSASILIHHAKICEIVIIQTIDQLIFGQTLAVQNIDEWAKRDRSKPYADRKKGMLAPKIARIMVNLALGLSHSDDVMFYDPCCGTGTVILEAMMLGLKTCASDLDPVAVSGTKQNISWLKQTYGQQTFATSHVFTSDATHVQLSQLPQPITHLVTEPYLGKPTPKDYEIPNIIKGLHKMYLGMFKQWRYILHDRAIIVIIFPQIITQNQTFNMEDLIDDLAKLGYTTMFQPIVYKRPQAIVQRQIYKFIYSK